MTPEDLEKLCIVMRKNYVLKCGDVELSPLAFFDQSALKTTIPIGSQEGYPTDDEFLFASSPFPMTPDELNAKFKPNG